MNTAQKDMNRRKFLQTAGEKTVAGVLAASGLSMLNHSSAYGSLKGDDLQKYDFILPRVKFKCDGRVPDQWNIHPVADKLLLEEFGQVVRCKVKIIPRVGEGLGHKNTFNAVVDFHYLEQLRRYPFLFMTAEGYFKFDDKQKVNLKQYILEGGFLLMDDCAFNRDGDFFYQSSYALLEDVFGTGAVKQIPREHEIFHNVYDLGRIGLPHLQGVDYGAQGLFIGDRIAVFLSSTDIHCGWMDRSQVRFGRKGQRHYRKHGYDEAIQMGINIIMYALSH